MWESLQKRNKIRYKRHGTALVLLIRQEYGSPGRDLDRPPQCPQDGTKRFKKVTWHKPSVEAEILRRGINVPGGDASETLYEKGSFHCGAILPRLCLQRI